MKTKILAIAISIFLIGCNAQSDADQLMPLVQNYGTTISGSGGKGVYIDSNFIGDLEGYFLRVNQEPFIFGYSYMNGPIYHSTADCSGDRFTEYQKGRTIGYFADNTVMEFHPAVQMISRSYDYAGQITCYQDNSMRSLSKYELNDPAVSGVKTYAFGTVTIK